MCEEHSFIEIVGKAGVIAGAGASAAWGGGCRSDRRGLLSLVQLLDEETLVTALLGDDKPTVLKISLNKTHSKQGVKK